MNNNVINSIVYIFQEPGHSAASYLEEETFWNLGFRFFGLNVYQLKKKQLQNCKWIHYPSCNVSKEF